MIDAGVLLRAYYECLHECLAADKERLFHQVEQSLRDELTKRRFQKYTEDKYQAYYEACLAFVQERLELYNPIGIQYTFDRQGSKEAVELELQLDWYDSRAEWETLYEAARAKVLIPVNDNQLEALVHELIQEHGAFPDKSIIAGYQAAPALNKLPDYIVAIAIEKTLVMED